MCRWTVSFERRFVLLLLMLCSAAAEAGLYPRVELERVREVYGVNIEAVLFDDIRAYLTPEELKSLNKVSLTFPLPDNKDSVDVFGFAIDLNSGQMAFPAQAIKFFDDLALSFAWYEHTGQDPTSIAEYVVNLHRKGLPFLPPLAALNVPEKAWEQSQYVDDVSQKILKSGLAFLLLHELAHWHFKHGAYHDISYAAARKQEQQADDFALEVMARMKTPPYGMVVWFLATSLVTSDRVTTHPLSRDRLNAIAHSLSESPGRYISYENRHSLTKQDILRLAQDIQDIAARLKQ
ncbi:MAG: M48 family metalloprotease [Thalassolituus sp.]|uniref:M48 family metalloprotease n=1 Tax=unclassified Thalassolituus TaxID=2624967 RepID=UPI0023B487D6|nr:MULTISPECIES: M48 family metalloprotease [unclassified Thalassolituus]MDQ4422996.1 M48 family metalloprotease [Thalassolituus sp.]MDQ4424913.1 M48 family metalloprotease [Thalassolituus sp.]